MTRYLVTGGSGFIGSALVRRLLRDGAEVRVFDDGSRGRLGRLDDVRADVEIVSGDIRDAAAVVDACHGVDAVCHLAAINGTRFFYSMPDRVLDVGIRGMLNVLDAARRWDIGRIYLASSSEVYQTPPRIPTPEDVPLTVPDPHNPRYSYAGSKIASELLLLNHARTGLRHVVVVRPHNVYGPDMGWEHVVPELALRTIDLSRSHAGPARLHIQGTGDETRAFCYIDDAVEGIVLAIAHGQHAGIYNVGTDVETKVSDVARTIARALGRDVLIVPGPVPMGAPPRRCPDISRLRALGYEPRTSLDAGIGVTVRWYEAHAHERPLPVAMSR